MFVKTSHLPQNIKESSHPVPVFILPNDQMLRDPQLELKL